MPYTIVFKERGKPDRYLCDEAGGSPRFYVDGLTRPTLKRFEMRELAERQAMSLRMMAGVVPSVSIGVEYFSPHQVAQQRLEPPM